jgi:preprotein translocase subunit SecG
MDTLLTILHVTVCIALIIIVLLQAGKGASIGASFGAGSSQTVFGAGGGQNFMHRVTVSAAVIFMLTSLTLAYFHGQPGSSSIMPEQVQTAQPSAPAPAPAEAPAPTAPAADTTDK